MDGVSLSMSAVRENDPEARPGELTLQYHRASWFFRVLTAAIMFGQSSPVAFHHQALAYRQRAFNTSDGGPFPAFDRALFLSCALL